MDSWKEGGVRREAKAARRGRGVGAVRRQMWFAKV